METIPALVRPHDDAAALELALIENMAREDLNPVEEARACAALVEELGLTREQVGRRVGRGRVAVSNLVRLLDLPDEALDLLEQGGLSEGHGRALLLAKDHTVRRRLARDARRRGLVGADVGGACAAQRRGGAGGAAGRASQHGPGSRAAFTPTRRRSPRRSRRRSEEALGAEVKVRPQADGGYRVELTFDSREEALALAVRLGGRTLA